jgi:hypothetical protein
VDVIVNWYLDICFTKNTECSRFKEFSGAKDLSDKVWKFVITQVIYNNRKDNFIPPLNSDFSDAFFATLIQKF